jgi:hypothetical protein
MVRSINRALSVLRRTLTGVSGSIWPDSTMLTLPTHLMRVSVERTLGDANAVAVRLAMTTDWRAQAAVIDPRLMSESLVVEQWEVDFGDGSRLTQEGSAEMPENVSVPHQYQSGFYLVTVTARGFGQERVWIDIPYTTLLAEGSVRVEFSCRVMATILIPATTQT